MPVSCNIRDLLRTSLSTSNSLSLPFSAHELDTTIVSAERHEIDSKAVCLSPLLLSPPSVTGSINPERFSVCHRTNSVLYSGSTFSGTQSNGRNFYNVKITLKYVDLARSYLCGYLNIKGLSEEHKDLTTFFDAEIIGPDYPFVTGKWEADASVDQSHWSQFPTFLSMDRLPPSDSTSVFMRWKELFLVPDHRVKEVSGASYAGFYYMHLDGKTGKMEGFYYHSNSEWYQKIVLTHDALKCLPFFEFR